MSSILFSPVTLGDIALNNRIVMAPMTRSRADTQGVPTDIMVDYYRQRASAGLIITEGVYPNEDGKGYCRTPGLCDDAQQAQWQKIVEAVHAEGGKIVLQLMHCGRIAARENKLATARTLAPSAIQASGKMFTDSGMKAFVAPEAMTLDDIQRTIKDYQTCAERAFACGFDGVELHCTSGYLPAQFLSTGTNQRTDRYGGTLENRLRFVIETLDALVSVNGPGRVGLRICPGNPFNDLHDDNPKETFTALLNALSNKHLAYLHAIRSPDKDIDVSTLAKVNFKGPLIINDGYDQDTAENAIEADLSDAVSFGRLFIANPDLVARFQSGASFEAFDMATLYTPGAAGYSDYPPCSKTGG